MKVSQNGWDEHTRIGFSKHKVLIICQVIKDFEKVLHKGIEIARRFMFRLWLGQSIRKARSPGMFDVQHGRRLGPRMFIVLELWSRFQTTKSGRSERLSDGRMLHHDPTIEGRTTGAAIEPRNDGAWNFWFVGFKQPKHGHALAFAIVGRKSSGIHFARKLSIGRLYLVEVMDQEIFLGDMVKGKGTFGIHRCDDDAAAAAVAVSVAVDIQMLSL